MKPRVRRVLIGMGLGTTPGLALLLISVPVSGELELTLAVTGIELAIAGSLGGGVAAFLTGRPQRP